MSDLSWGFNNLFPQGSGGSSVGFGDWLSAGTGLFGSLVNAGLQKENRDYNERMTREAWAREDNAVRRRVADLKAAGLSPTLAAGSAADSSSAARSDPIQVDIDKLNLVMQKLQIASQRKDIDRQDAEIQYIRARTRGQNYENDMLKPNKFAHGIASLNRYSYMNYDDYANAQKNLSRASYWNRTNEFFNYLDDSFGIKLPSDYKFAQTFGKGMLDLGVLSALHGKGLVENIAPYLVDNADKLTQGVHEMLDYMGKIPDDIRDLLDKTGESLDNWAYENLFPFRKYTPYDLWMRARKWLKDKLNPGSSGGKSF